MTDTPERQQVDAIALLTFDAAARLNSEQLATTIGAELQRIVNPFVHDPHVKGLLREVELAGFRIVNLQQEGAIYGNAPRVAHPDRITDALMRADAFMSGFEDDELQEGIADDLAVIRAALIERENRSLSVGEAILYDRVSVVVNITGGILQGASSTYEGVDIYTLDFETDGMQPHELIMVEDTKAHRGECSALHDPEFVNSIIDAPTLDEAETSADRNPYRDANGELQQ